MKYLFRYLKPYRLQCILAPLFKLLEVVFELSVPLIVAYVIDEGIAHGDNGVIVRASLLLLLFGVLGLSATVCAQYFSAKAACGFARNIKSALFSHIGTLSYADLDRVGTPRLITSMTSDVNQVQSGTNLTLRLLLRSPFVVFGAVLMAFTIDIKGAISFVVVVPILLLFVFALMLISITLYKKVQAALSRLLGRTRENLNGVRVIRAFGGEEEQTEAFCAENSVLSRRQRFVGAISALLNPLTYVIINLGVIFLVQSSSIRIDSGDLSQGELVALWNYMSQILVELIKLASLVISITKAIACGNRIGALLCLVPSQSYPEHAPEENDAAPAVAFRNASLRYHEGSALALEEVSFSAARGEVVGIIGGTGCGKSSLVNMIARFYDATEGEVLVNGVNVKDYPKDVLLSKIAVVPQKSVLFSGSIRDNLQWGKENATDEECMRAIRLAQAEDVVSSKEGGLDYRIEQGGRNLSGGQRQRLAIARALVKDAEILILDDAASALDYATDAALRRALSSLSATVFVVSQRIASVRHADKILVMDDGRVTAVGKHDELLLSCEVYREIYESQHRGEDEV